MNANAKTLLLSSILMAFVEMMLIRWIGSNIFTLYFFTNFVVIASFLGIGIGFLRAGSKRNYFSWSPALLSLVVLLAYVYAYEYHPVVNKTTGILDYSASYYKKHLYPIYLTLPFFFVLVTLTMACIASKVANEFRKFPSLQAYRLEVLGTLGGIIIFAGLSFLETPPIIWGITITLFYAALTWPARDYRFSFTTVAQITALALMLSVFYLGSNADKYIWSTYYKIQVKEFAENRHVINVNGLAQQVVDSVAQRKKLKPFYFKPYEHMTNRHSLDNVLVIGAGTGGDVAIALAQGAKHVDAVEIDPALYNIGKRIHPDQPYADPRVTVHINDGRAFLQQSAQQYDLIIYALTDSLMLIPGQSSLRLENYLYTVEGLTAAASHLKPNGVFAIYNYYMLKWFADRMANTLNIVYQASPCIDTYNSLNYNATALTTSFNQQTLSCPQRWESQHASYEQPATDSHPFIYLQNPTLTPLHMAGLLFVALLALALIRATGTSYAAIPHYFDLFLMGAAFLLLETKSVVNYALLFGSTWMVNTLVFTGILLSVYIAIEVISRVDKLNRYTLYTLLCLSLFAAWMIPTSSLLTFSPAVRAIIATGLTFSPIFLANLIFADRLSEISTSTDAMGANLLGAVFGGLLEYISLAIGYQHFALLILVIYSVALAWLVTQVRSLHQSYIS